MIMVGAVVLDKMEEMYPFHDSITSPMPLSGTLYTYIYIMYVHTSHKHKTITFLHRIYLYISKQVRMYC